MLKVSNLHVKYGERLVLKDVSFEVERGTILGVIGPNGAGKTTLIRAMCGTLPVDRGKIEVNGKNVCEMADQERARLVAVVPQARNLPAAFTGREMVQLGRTPYLNWLGQLTARD